MEKGGKERNISLQDVVDRVSERAKKTEKSFCARISLSGDFNKPGIEN